VENRKKRALGVVDAPGCLSGEEEGDHVFIIQVRSMRKLKLMLCLE